MSVAPELLRIINRT